MDRKQSRQLLERLERDAQRITERFGLQYRSLEAERANVKSRYGICYSDGTIKIRLRHASTGRALKYSSLVSTLCHELAHLRHFNHGVRFRRFYRELLEWSRSEGIYQPQVASEKIVASSAPRKAQELPPGKAPKIHRPVQLEFFEF